MNKNECKITVENKMIDSLLFYFMEYPEERKETAENFKQAFNDLVDQILKEINEEEG